MEITAAVLAGMNVASPYATSRPLTFETLGLDPPGPGEVLVRIKAAGLCHSDLSVINGNRPRPMPMALGHEAAGIVEEVGPVEGAKSDLVPGDHVVFVFVPSCGHCEPCTVGRPALCEPGAAANGAGTLLSGARRLHRGDGTAVNHHLGVSGFADYATVSRHSLVKVDPDLPLNEAALFGCAVLTGVGAVFNTAQVPAGSSVAVIGLGGVGLSSLLGAVATGARRVVAIARSEHKLAFARELGATDTFNARDPDVDRGDQSRHPRRGRICLRDGWLAQRARHGLPDHPARRHHRHRRAPSTHRHPPAAPSHLGRRRTHPQRQLYRHRGPRPRHPPLHRALPPRPAPRRQTPQRNPETPRTQRRLRPPPRRHSRPAGGPAMSQVVRLSVVPA